MHRLEITPPLPEPKPEHSHSALRLADLTSEEGLHGRISQYERKIDSLLTEVSSLKNEVSFFLPLSGSVVLEAITSFVFVHWLIISKVVFFIVDLIDATLVVCRKISVDSGILFILLSLILL